MSGICAGEGRVAARSHSPPEKTGEEENCDSPEKPKTSLEQFIVNFSCKPACREVFPTVR